MKIECEVQYVDDVMDKQGRPQKGVRVTCGECAHTTESFGTGEGSVRRCLALLKEECPKGQSNYYVGDD